MKIKKQEDMEPEQQFIEMVVRAIVNNPADVRTDRKVDEKGVLLTLHVNPADMGYAVGKRGKTAESLRTLLRIVGAKNNARVSLQIHDPSGRPRPMGPRPMGDSSAGSGSGMGDIDTSAVDNLNI